MEEYLECWRKYAIFEGRARRREYWLFNLFNVLAIAGILIISAMLESQASIVLVGGYMLAIIVPSLAVAVRRMHDQGKSGSWFLIRFVPLVGGIWYLVLTASEGDRGPNQYGPDPKDPDSGHELYDSEIEEIGENLA